MAIVPVVDSGEGLYQSHRSRVTPAHQQPGLRNNAHIGPIRLDRDLQVRATGMASFSDFSAGPSVVIGGSETNQWSADLAKGSRFQLARLNGRSVIVDRQTNQAVCAKPQPWEPPALQDCALVTRLRQPTTGHPVLLAAGLDHYGTYAVGEFVTDPRLLLPVLAAAPAGWESKNLQILYRVDRLRDGVGAPQLQAIHVW